LAEFHLSDNALARDRDSSDFAERMRLPVLANWLSHLIPAVSAQARRLANRIAARQTQRFSPPRFLHGDFYAKQVLLRNGNAAFIDFDEGFWGDPAYDLGSFLAHLESDAIRGYVPAARVPAIRDASLTGYRRGAGFRHFQADGDLELTSRVDLYAA